MRRSRRYGWRHTRRLSVPCTICGQHEYRPGWWPHLCDEDTGRQDVKYVDCDVCGTKHVCGDCHHESQCCDAARWRWIQELLADPGLHREHPLCQTHAETVAYLAGVGAGAGDA